MPARGSTTTGVITATRGVITRGVLTRERFRSETSLLFHSHTILPVMVRLTLEPGDGSKNVPALLRCRTTATGRELISCSVGVTFGYNSLLLNATGAERGVKNLPGMYFPTEAGKINEAPFMFSLLKCVSGVY